MVVSDSTEVCDCFSNKLKVLSTFCLYWEAEIILGCPSLKTECNLALVCKCFLNKGKY